MAWVKLFYFPNPIKTHIVHSSVKDSVIEDVRERHGYLPEEESVVESLRIDPGGMICLANKPHTFKLDCGQVEVQPEHILMGMSRWGKKRTFDEQVDGEDVHKVYLSALEVAVVPAHIYDQVGGWLASLMGQGHVARAEMVETLKECGVIVVPQPEDAPIGEA